MNATLCSKRTVGDYYLKSKRRASLERAYVGVPLFTKNANVTGALGMLPPRRKDPLYPLYGAGLPELTNVSGHKEPGYRSRRSFQIFLGVSSFRFQNSHSETFSKLLVVEFELGMSQIPPGVPRVPSGDP